MDIPVQIGGLAVQPGGHLGPPRPPRPLGQAARTLTPGYRATGLEALAPAAPGGRALGGPQ